MCINYPTLCAMTKTSLPFFLSCLLFFHKGYLMSSTAARLICPVYSGRVMSRHMNLKMCHLSISLSQACKAVRNKLKFFFLWGRGQDLCPTMTVHDHRCAFDPRTLWYSWLPFCYILPAGSPGSFSLSHTGDTYLGLRSLNGEALNIAPSLQPQVCTEDSCRVDLNAFNPAT